VDVRLSSPDNAVVVVAGIPGAGTPTVEVVDTDDHRRDGEGRILAAVRGSRPIVIHSRGTVGTLRRAIATVAALHGRPAR